MTLRIEWLERVDTEEGAMNVLTAAGILRLYLCNDVITKTEWCLGGLEVDLSDSELARRVQTYLHNQSCDLAIKLLKQGTNYRHKVWNEICKIPAGEVIYYSDLAKKVDSGARAVANACRDNPFPGIIPCHRVLSKSGLGGYMGQTRGQFLTIKKKLLAIEAGSYEMD